MPALTYDKRDHYAIFTMNRPERLNANNNEMTDALHVAMNDFNADPEMRAGILTGTGRAFSSGADLKEMTERIVSGGLQSVDAATRMSQGSSGTGSREGETGTPFSKSLKPFIAAVNGLAVGGGLDRVLDCDIRICSSDAWFASWEPKRGRVSGAVHDLPRLIGSAAANYILFTCDRIQPEQALHWGIVTEVVEPERLMPRAVEIADMITENAPLAMRATKALTRAWFEAKLDDDKRLHQWVDLSYHYSDDAMEGPRAFAEGRKPNWKGR